MGAMVAMGAMGLRGLSGLEQYAYIALWLEDHGNRLQWWQKLHRGTGGTRRKVWMKILSPNIRYFVAN